MLKKLLPVVAIGAAISLAACEPAAPSGAQKETRATEQLLNQAATVVGVPAIKNFTEKRQLRMLYELRDTANLVTYSYIVTLDGTLKPVCPTTSVGFGMPFSAQFTAPSVDKPYYSSGSSIATIHQPEPNGLYMPDSTSATWVICLGSDGQSLNPVYVEPTIMVSVEPLQ